MVTEQRMRMARNERIAKDIYRTVLIGDTSALSAPGQFVQVAVPGFYLRRPLSVCDWDDTSLTLIYKTVGDGTHAMAQMQAGQELDLLIALGNGFDTAVPMKRPLLIGGGVGVPPLYGLAKALRAMDLPVRAVLGFQTADDVFYETEFSDLGCEVTIITNDGSHGAKGFVTDVIKSLNDRDYFFTCGPEPMLMAVHAITVTPGQLSFEERMACGFGACMGCSCKTVTGYKRICKEGPVLTKEEIWQIQPSP